jgi:phosphoglycolate phosphatase
VSRAPIRNARRRPPKLRAVVTDVDGTLTDARRRVDLNALRYLRALESKGIRVVLATGNVLPVALALHRFIGLSGPIVAENGGLIYRNDAAGERVEKLADQRVALRGLARLRRSGISVRRLFTDRWRVTEVGLEPSVPVHVIRAALRGMDLTVESTGFAIHLMQAGAGKLPAIERALGPEGLDLSDCLIAGDGDNDVPMLRRAGWAVSFPTASPAARRAADFVSRAPYAQGFVEALKRASVVAR